MAVPYEGHAELLGGGWPTCWPARSWSTAVNPLGWDKQGAFALDVTEGSATEQAAALLPHDLGSRPRSTTSARPLLNDLTTVPSVDTDILVLGEGEDRDATDLVQRAGRRRSPACAACTPGGCATPTRSRR